MAHHGWESTAEALSALAARGEWAAMPGLISDDMLDTFAVSAPLGDLAGPLRQRYTGLLDRLSLYRSFKIDEDQAAWARLAAGIKNP